MPQIYIKPILRGRNKSMIIINHNRFTGGDSSLVAYYPFNGNANDESGNGNDAIDNEAVLTTDRFGNTNSAYSFDGASTMDIPHKPSLNFHDKFTISLWMYKTNIDNDGVLISKHEQQPIFTPQWLIRSRNLGFRVFVSGDGATQQYITTENVISYETWYHVAVVFDLSIQSILVYVDGVVLSSLTKGTLPITLYNSDVDIQIGGEHYYAYEYSGKIDDIKIYNRVLTPEEITLLYNE